MAAASLQPTCVSCVNEDQIMTIKPHSDGDQQAVARVIFESISAYLRIPMTVGQSATTMLPKHTKTSGPSPSATSHVCSQGGSSPWSEGGGKGGEGGGDTGGEEEGVEAAVGSDALS